MRNRTYSQPVFVVFRSVAFRLGSQWLVIILANLMSMKTPENLPIRDCAHIEIIHHAYVREYVKYK